MKALVGAFNQEKALPSRGLLRDCTTSPINRFAAPEQTQRGLYFRQMWLADSQCQGVRPGYVNIETAAQLRARDTETRRGAASIISWALLSSSSANFNINVYIPWPLT